MLHSYDTKTNNFFKIYSPEELTEIVKESVEFYHNQYEESIAETKKTKEELRQEVKEEYENELKNLREWQRLTLIHFNSQKEKEAYENFWNEHNEKHYGTKLRKVGAFLGDEVEVGCNSVLNPGTVIGRNSNIYPLSCVRGIIPENSIYKNKNEIVIKKAKI